MCCDHHTCQSHTCDCTSREDSCQCGETYQFTRRFQTREEQVARLEQYLADLQAETRAVNEQIARLQAA